MGKESCNPLHITHAEESLRALLNASTESAFLMDIDGTIIASNQVAAERLGMSVQEIEGINAYKLIPPDVAESRKTKIQVVVDSRAPIRFEDKRAGRILDNSIHPIIDSEGTINRVAVFTTDITEQRNTETVLRRNEQYLKNLITHINTGVVVHAPDTSIKLINPMAQEFLGIKYIEAKGEKASSELWKFVKEDGSELPLEMYPVNQVISNGKELRNFVMGSAPQNQGTTRWLLVNAFPIIHNDSIEEIIVSFMDITERKRSQAELETNASIFNNLAEGVYLIGLDDLKIKWANPVFEAMFGYDKGELIGKQVDIVNAPTDRTPAETRAAIIEMLEKTGEWHGEVQNIRKDGTGFWCHANVSTFDHNEYGKVIVSVHTDITDWKEIEEKLHKSYKMFETVLNSLDAIVYVADMDTYELLFVNEYTRKLIGEDINDKPCWQYLQVGQSGPCDFCTNKFLTDKRGSPSGPYRWDFKNTKSGMWFSISDKAIEWVDGRIVRLEIAKDITELKTLEEELRDALEMKDMLMKEVHHRVKNNLVIIQSLVSIQSRSVGSETKKQLGEIENRVRTLSMIHERLYRSDDLSSLEAGEYIRSLATELYHSLNISPERINLRVDVPDIYLDVNVIIPCGLIINELLTNAFKYAFPENAKGEIIVKFTKGPDETYLLSVKDSGIGLPEGFSIESSKTLGLQIVSSLVNQIKGHVQVISGKGTEFRISFKAEYPEAHPQTGSRTTTE
ncbi:PAS domain S-box protein [Nitrospirota bacterium]